MRLRTMITTFPATSTQANKFRPGMMYRTYSRPSMFDSLEDGGAGFIIWGIELHHSIEHFVTAAQCWSRDVQICVGPDYTSRWHGEDIERIIKLHAWDSPNTMFLRNPNYETYQYNPYKK